MLKLLHTIVLMQLIQCYYFSTILDYIMFNAHTLAYAILRDSRLCAGTLHWQGVNDNILVTLKDSRHHADTLALAMLRHSSLCRNTLACTMLRAHNLHANTFAFYTDTKKTSCNTLVHTTFGDLNFFLHFVWEWAQCWHIYLYISWVKSSIFNMHLALTLLPHFLYNDNFIMITEWSSHFTQCHCTVTFILTSRQIKSSWEETAGLRRTLIKWGEMNRRLGGEGEKTSLAEWKDSPCKCLYEQVCYREDRDCDEDVRKEKKGECVFARSD